MAHKLTIFTTFLLFSFGQVLAENGTVHFSSLSGAIEANSTATVQCQIGGNFDVNKTNVYYVVFWAKISGEEYKLGLWAKAKTTAKATFLPLVVPSSLVITVYHNQDRLKSLAAFPNYQLQFRLGGQDSGVFWCTVSDDLMKINSDKSIKSNAIKSTPPAFSAFAFIGARTISRGKPFSLVCAAHDLKITNTTTWDLVHVTYYYAAKENNQPETIGSYLLDGKNATFSVGHVPFLTATPGKVNQPNEPTDYQVTLKPTKKGAGGQYYCSVTVKSKKTNQTREYFSNELRMGSSARWAVPSVVTTIILSLTMFVHF